MIFALRLIAVNRSTSIQDQSQGSGRSSSIKATKVTLFTVILYHSEKSIRDIKPIYRPLFCHSGVVFISLTAVNPRLRLNHQTLLKSPHPHQTYRLDPSLHRSYMDIVCFCLLKALAAELRLWFGKCTNHSLLSFFEAGTPSYK